MLARRSNLNHPIGSVIDLPRLIPAFSSKGFPFTESSTNGRISEVNRALEIAGPSITDSILLSAYDIHHGYLTDPIKHLGNKELAFVDSGGYELSQDFESTEPKTMSYTPDTSYDRNAHIDVLKNLPTSCPIVISNFDDQNRGTEIREQILDAKRLFNNFGHFLHDFIIKPTRKADYVNPAEIEGYIENMRGFHIVGVTEKELGNTMLKRLICIAKLRNALDRHSMSTPIHVWGGLDPVLTPLYFIAGAELFDGLSWLRYGYLNDTAISRDSYNTIDQGVKAPWRRAEAMRLSKNVIYLETLTIRMRRFVDEGTCDFSVFEKSADTIGKAYHTLRTEIPDA